VLSLALDGSLSVSLWNKNAHSLIENRSVRRVIIDTTISSVDRCVCAGDDEMFACYRHQFLHYVSRIKGCRKIIQE